MFFLEFCGEKLFFFKVPFDIGKHDLVNFLHYFRSSSLCLAGVEKKRKITSNQQRIKNWPHIENINYPPPKWNSKFL